MKTSILHAFIVLSLSSCMQVVFVSNPLTYEEHVNLGYIYEKQGKVELAEKEYKKAIRKNKKHWLAYYNLGNLYARRSEWDKAEEYYKKALEFERDADAFNNLAYVLNEKGEHCEALFFVEKALKMEKKEEYIKTKEEVEKAIKTKNIKCSTPEGEWELG